MAFSEYSSRKTLPEIEEEILSFWREEEILRQVVEATAKGPKFVFYEGPPTANGRPGLHHVLSRVYKDIYIRFYTQQGYHVPRKAGWDCHGLPVEREVEKQLGIKSKSEIEERVGLEEFNRLCRESVMQYIDEWNRFTERLGFSVDLDEAYYTLHDSYIESVWGLLKVIWDKGLIYQGYKVVPYDPVMGATLSDAEVALGYQTVEDPSLTVRFRLRGEGHDFGDNASLLVWTTTPWTLPSNVALAVHPDEEYLCVERTLAEGEIDVNGKAVAAADAAAPTERLIFAVALRDQLFNEEERVGLREVMRFPGRKLELVAYQPLFDWMRESWTSESHYLTLADFVTMDTGTGIVHIAPAYGADDLEVGKSYDLPVVHAVAADGRFVKETPLDGTFFKEADAQIIRLLKDRGQVWRSERYKHDYPFGWRTGAPLLYFAKDAWYIRTTDLRDLLVANNRTIRWVPDHIQEGRFGNWLQNNRDWALSRERYWGTPLPVWTDGEGGMRIIGSVAELEKLSGVDLKNRDLHRPYIDEVTFIDPDSKKLMRRVPEVIDCWFDSGAMPYAQWGYPVSGKAEFENSFPADYICEAIDQTRGWFYTLLAVSTMVSGISSYKNVICLGHVVDAKGEKMSKSKGNTVDPWEVFGKHGADAIRWYFLTSAPPGASRRVGKPGAANDPVVQVHGFFNMLRNSMGFFTMYAVADGLSADKGGDWESRPFAGAEPFAKRQDMDRWILSALQQLIEEVSAALGDYDSLRAGRAIERFSDSLSNWYIRRNRRRFWKGSLDADKFSAYDTLFRSLVTLARLMAPFTPYLAEEIWRTLVTPHFPSAPRTIQLAGWPKADMAGQFDAGILREGDLVQQAAELGRSARMQSGRKVRQPLSRMMVHVGSAADRAAIERNRDVLLDELNVKSLEFLDDSAGILDYRIKPNLPRLGKRLGPKIKALQQALATADTAAIVARARSGGSIELPLSDGTTLELEAEDLLIESLSREGTSGAEAGGILVALDTELTSTLIAEGQVRDLVRLIQELRKKSGLQVTDRIRLELVGQSDDFAAVIEGFRSYIEEETLAELLLKDAPAKGALGSEVVEIEPEKMTIWLYK